MEMLTVFVILLTAASFCNAAAAADDHKTVEVVGIGECADCLDNNIKTAHAFKGLRVSIDCKAATGEVKTRGAGELDEQGKFRVEFPQDLVENGKLKEECYAQLHSISSNTPCPAYESNQIGLASQSDGEKHTFSPVGKLKFSPFTCTSAFLWYHHKKYFPYFPIYKKPIPHFPIYKKPIPHFPIYKKPLPPIPIYKKPILPPIPVFTKPIPVYKKPCPPIWSIPHIPVYEPKPHPFYKLFPPHPFYHHKELPSFPHP